jgi:hypothetical protein
MTTHKIYLSTTVKPAPFNNHNLTKHETKSVRNYFANIRRTNHFKYRGLVQNMLDLIAGERRLGNQDNAITIIRGNC